MINPCHYYFGFTTLTTRYASQDIWCLAQARINWEGCARKGIRHKMVWMAEGCQLVRMGWQSIRIVGASACVIFILLQKILKMAYKDMTFGYHCVGAPTCLHKQEVGKPSWNAAQPCARAQSFVNDDLWADGLWKCWGFWVGTWNVDSLTAW